MFIVMAGLPQRVSLRLSYPPIFTSPLTPLEINVLFILQTVSNCIASPISSRHSLWGRTDQFVHSLRARSDGRLNRLILIRNYSSDNYHAQEMLALALRLDCCPYSSAWAFACSSQLLKSAHPAYDGWTLYYRDQ